MRIIPLLVLCCGVGLSSCTQGTRQEVKSRPDSVQVSNLSELGIGQTWNRSLTKRIGQIRGWEARRAGVDSLPLPAFGYGDSPYLVAELGIEMSKGLYASVPVTGLNRQSQGDVMFRAAFERIVDESGVLAAKTYEDVADTSAVALEQERQGHHEVALQAYRESIVLLKNAGGVLPVEPESRVFHSLPYYIGNAQAKALDEARQADVIAVYRDAEVARVKEANEWLASLTALGKPVVLVLSGDRPFAVDRRVEQSVAAVIAAWFPGLSGREQVAEVIRGVHRPGSRLTAALYDTDGNVLYPMGHGVNMTPVAYTDLTLEPVVTDKGRNVIVRFKVTNTSDLPGEEVALLYVQRVPGADAASDIRLEGFKRTNLKAGETKEVKLTIRGRNVEVVDAAMNRTVVPGEYKVTLSGEVPAQSFRIGD